MTTHDIIERALQPRIIETNGEDQNICAFCYAVIEDENSEHEPDCMQPIALQEYKVIKETHQYQINRYKAKLHYEKEKVEKLESESADGKLQKQLDEAKAEIRNLRMRHKVTIDNLVSKLKVARSYSRKLKPMQPKLRTDTIYIHEAPYMVAGQISLADDLRKGKMQGPIQDVPVLIVVERE